MNNYPKLIRKRLNRCINRICLNKDDFVQRAGRDFSRIRKLSLYNLIHLIITFRNKSSSIELLEFYGHKTGILKVSSLLEQRLKLKSEAFLTLLQEFAASLKILNRYKGYRLLAVDGTKVTIPTNTNDDETYVLSNKKSKGHNLLNVNALYDILNKIYIDVVIQTYRQTNEFLALVEMIKRSCFFKKVILIADRGYESYNNIAHLENKGWKYLIRVKASNVGKGLLCKADLPVDDEFDKTVSILMTRRQTKEIKSKPLLYRFLAKVSTFDFLPHGEKGTYPLSFRVVCVKLSENNYEYLITNLDEKFDLNELKRLYFMRWSLETSFRELKHTIGMLHFHSKKRELIQQEIYASMILYNFCEMITLNVVIKQDKNRKYIYQVRFKEAVSTCIAFLDCSRKRRRLPDVEAVIADHITPIRPDRTFQRNVTTQPAKSFFYRIA